MVDELNLVFEYELFCICIWSSDEVLKFLFLLLLHHYKNIGLLKVFYEKYEVKFVVIPGITYN